MRPLLLCIHMNREKVMRLGFLALSLGADVRPVAEEAQGQTLAALCGLEEKAARCPAAQVGEELLVMASFPDALLDRLLPALRAAGLTVRLKAVLTPVNRDWNCGRLYAELRGEASAFEKGNKK